MNTINEVMDLDLFDLSDKNLDVIIAYERKMKAQADAGVKPGKGDSGPKVDLGKLGLRKSVEVEEGL